MTVAINGRLENREYRRFKIKFKDTPDDFEMMREVLRRRFKRSLLEDSWRLPNLIILDGGKGQLSAGLEVLEEMKIELCMISIAKRDEILIYQDRGEFEFFMDEGCWEYVDDEIPEKLGIAILGLRFSDIVDMYFKEEEYL